METTNPLEALLVETLFDDSNWMEAGKERAVDADMVTSSEQVEEAFDKLSPPEQELLITKLLQKFDPMKQKMFLAWAEKYK